MNSILSSHFQDLKSLTEEMTEAKSYLPNTGSRDLRQRRRSHHVYLCHLCLGTFGNVLYLSPCFHNLCFSCTRLLLKTKPECPLCKQSFHSVFNPAKTKMYSAEHFQMHPAKCTKEDPLSCLTQKNLIGEDDRITEHQAHHGYYYWLAIRKKETSEQRFPGRMKNNKAAFNSIPGLRKTGDYDQDRLHYQATLTSLPWSDMKGATLMLIAFGIFLFISLYIYFSLVLLPE